MRGSVSIEQAYLLDQVDRSLIGKIVEENMEITAKSKIAFI